MIISEGLEWSLPWGGGCWGAVPAGTVPQGTRIWVSRDLELGRGCNPSSAPRLSLQGRGAALNAQQNKPGLEMKVVQG